jgi:sodium-dependent phosphate transporter
VCCLRRCLPPLLTPLRYGKTSSFPFVSGIVPVVLSWIISPLLAGLVAAIIFLVVRTLVLRRANSTSIAYWALPVFVLITIWVNGARPAWVGAEG